MIFVLIVQCSTRSSDIFTLKENKLKILGVYLFIGDIVFVNTNQALMSDNAKEVKSMSILCLCAKLR